MINHSHYFLRCLLVAITLICPICPTMVCAHPPGLSSAELTLKSGGVESKITFALQDIEAFAPMDSDQDAEVTPSEREAAKPQIAALVAQQELVEVNGSLIQPSDSGQVSFDDQNNARVDLYYAVASVQRIGLQSPLLKKMPPGHKQFVTVKDNTGKNLGEKMLVQADTSADFSLRPVANTETAEANTETPSTFLDFLKLGIEHILTGYDHLLFLFSLLVVTRSFWPAIKIITFFTIAHSITLALAGFNLVELSGRIVEPLIAATILYVGLENIICGDRVKYRGVLTFMFGLIHGFGFASVLREMGISSGTTGILLPLFSFNFGVEIGQITVASLILPTIWWLYAKPTIGFRLAPVCSVLVSLAGSYWLLERTLFG